MATRRTLSAAVLATLALAGCSARARYERSVLPEGLSGPPPAIDASRRTEIDAERVRLTREYLEIHNPEVAAALPAGDGPESIRFVPRLIVVHWTAIPTLAGTLDAFRGREIGAYRAEILRNGRLNVGIQFVVDRDGTIYALYPENAIARHVIGLNHVAIGIENVGAAGLGGPLDRAPLTEAQLESNVALVRWLAGRYPTIDYLIGHQEYRDLEDPRHPARELFHEEIADYRTEKNDPGRRFLRRLRRELADAAR
jgi:hypothetical protein